MKVLRAKTAGFCMGVSLALHKLDKALKQTVEKKNGRILTFGPIIHNPQVLKDYAAKGALCTENIADIEEGDTVIIRAHGVPQADKIALGLRKAIICDATCPKVKQAQISIARATDKKQTLLLFGDEDHPEVRGLISYAENNFYVFDSIRTLQNIKLSETANYVLAAQTTQDLHEFEHISLWLKEKFPNITILQTICDATQKRQDEALIITANVDAMVVVGGKNSGNTRRLASLVREKGIPAWHVEVTEELLNVNFSGIKCIGLTAGASTPDTQIDLVQDFIEQL